MVLTQPGLAAILLPFQFVPSCTFHIHVVPVSIAVALELGSWQRQSLWPVAPRVAAVQFSLFQAVLAQVAAAPGAVVLLPTLLVLPFHTVPVRFVPVQAVVPQQV